ncbi:MAG: hypothetical protein WA871_05095 [Candidatus Acidiferrales bacterium]
MSAPAIEPVLRAGQLIPPLVARAPDGTPVNAWDYRQKRNLCIAFLHAECATCAGYTERLARRAADFAERDAVALVILPKLLPPGTSLSAPLLLAADPTGKSHVNFFGKKAANTGGAGPVGIFLADRYGQLSMQWLCSDACQLPSPEEILTGLSQTERAGDG